MRLTFLPTRLKELVVEMKIRVLHGQRTTLEGSMTRAVLPTANSPYALLGIISANDIDDLGMGPCVEAVGLPGPRVTFRPHPVPLAGKRTTC